MSTGTPTPNFGLNTWVGGPPGVGDPISRAELNENFSDIDLLARAVYCTSTTRPSSPFDGQVIFESDTRILSIRALSSWVRVNYIPVFNNTSDVPAGALYNGMVIWSLTGFGFYVYKSSTTTWTPLTHDQYYTSRLGTNTALNNSSWTAIPFTTTGEGGMAGLSTSDSITYTLTEPGIWTVCASATSVSSAPLIAALFRGTNVDPRNAANNEIYAMTTSPVTSTISAVLLTAQIRVATASSRSVRFSVFTNVAAATLENSGPSRARMTFNWAPL